MIKEIQRFKQIQQTFVWLSLAICVSIYCYAIYVGKVPLDIGDGLEHYAISRDAWKNNTNFLNHWGKPFFILFSSGFAQFGFKVYTFFNVLVFASTIMISYSILRHFRAPIIAFIVLPFVFISIPEYSQCVIAGLTEPFFGLLITILLWAIIYEKWLLFAIIASFVPFARSEGMLVISIAPFVLMAYKQWKIIPFLITGFVIYALVGMWILDQPLWYFENDPYPIDSPYGKGNWSHYLMAVQDYTGLFNVLFFPFYIFGWLIWRSHHHKKAITAILFVSIIFFGIIAIHSYYWANGLRGSMGLTRIATQGTPAFITLGFIGLSYFLNELHKLTHTVIGIAISFLFVKEINELILIREPNSFELNIEKSVAFVNDIRKTNKVYYFHPLIAYYNGHTTKETINNFHHQFTHLATHANNCFKPGDLLIRDSKFGPIEQGLSLEELKQYPWILPIKHFYSFNTSSGHFEEESVIIYQVFDTSELNSIKQKIKKASKTIKLKLNQRHYTVQTQNEFYDISKQFTVPNEPGNAYSIEVAFTNLGQNNDCSLVFDAGKGHYNSYPIKGDKGQLSLRFYRGGLKGKMYIYNPSKTPIHLNLSFQNWLVESDIDIHSIEK